MFEILKAPDISAFCGGKYTVENGYKAVELILNDEKTGFCIYKITEDLLTFAELDYPAADPALGDALLRAVLNTALLKQVSTADFADISENPAAARYKKSGPFDIARFFASGGCPCGC